MKEYNLHATILLPDDMDEDDVDESLLDFQTALESTAMFRNGRVDYVGMDEA